MKVRPRVVVVCLLAALVGGVVSHRLLIARSVFHHPAIGTLEQLADRHGWEASVDDRRSPGLEPLWLAGMMDDPYRRVVIFDTAAPLEVSGPAVEAALFIGGRWQPPHEEFGLQWRTSRLVPTLNRHMNATGSLPGMSFHATPIERPDFYERTRRLRVEVTEEAVAVIVTGGKRLTRPHQWTPLLEGVEEPVWHGRQDIDDSGHELVPRPGTSPHTPGYLRGHTGATHR